VTIRRYHPEDFLIIFSYANDMLRVLHDPPSVDAPFVLIFKPWRRQAMASMEEHFYRVSLWIWGILAHIWSLSIVCKLLLLVCSNIRPTQATLEKTDLRRMTVVFRCIHPDLIPVEKILFV
jgi:hypothetical protein